MGVNCHNRSESVKNAPVLSPGRSFAASKSTGSGSDSALSALHSTKADITCSGNFAGSEMVARALLSLAGLEPQGGKALEQNCSTTDAAVSCSTSSVDATGATLGGGVVSISARGADRIIFSGGTVTVAPTLFGPAADNSRRR